MEVRRAVLSLVSSSDMRISTSRVADQVSSALGVPRTRVKRAMNELVFEGALEFSYYGRSYIEAPFEDRRGRSRMRTAPAG